MWWSSPSKAQMYKRNGHNWLLYIHRFGRQYYYSCSAITCPIDLVLPVSIRMDANNFGIKVQAQAINILPLMDTLSDFADKDGWESLADGLAAAVEDLTIT